MKPSKSVSTAGIFVGLVSLHYGMGFILGTGEQTYLYGASGAVYAVASGLGLIGLGLLAGFYWREKEPIWDLLGNQYGEMVRHLTNFLSWVWMIGVMAGQIVGAGYALSTLGIPANLAIGVMAFAIAVLGPIPLEDIAWIFAALLVISTLALIVGLGQLGGIAIYLKSFELFVPSILFASPLRMLGISITTILLTLIGMDFQQVLVRGQSETSAIRGSLFAGLALIPVAFLPTAVVLGGLQNNIIAAQSINGKDAIPLIISTIGNKIFPGGGLVLVIGLVLVAINSGSGLNRALIRSIQTAPFMPAMLKRSTVASWINALLSLGLALSGLTIVGLMVSFYAIYVAGVFVPFIAYLVERRRGLHIPATAIQWAAWAGCGMASLVFVAGLLGQSFHSSLLAYIAETPEMWMILAGLTVSACVLLFAYRFKKMTAI